MKNYAGQEPKTSLGRTQIILAVVGFLALVGYFMYNKFGYFGIPGIFFAEKTYDESQRINQNHSIDRFLQPYIEKLDYTILTPLVEPQMSPFRDDFCTIINDRETYARYVTAYGGELCNDCGDINFDEFSILGQVVEDVQYDTPGIPGFNKYVFKDTYNSILTYIVASKDVEQPSFIEKVDAAYLEPDTNWLIKIPRIPDWYDVECLAWTNQ